MATMDTPLVDVVGGKTARALAKALDLNTVGDLMRHYPRRYAERGELTDLTNLAVGDHVTVLAEIRRVNLRPMRNRAGKLLEVVVGDGFHNITLTFFNQPWRERELQVGKRGLFAGKVSEFRGNRQLNSPDYQLLAADSDVVSEVGDDGQNQAISEAAEEFAGALIPVYPAAAGLASWTIARCVRLALDVLDPPADPLPEELRAKHKLLELTDALQSIHLPDDWPAVQAARTRLKWDEALVLQVILAQRRRAAADRPAQARPKFAKGILAAFDARLPFELTAGQRDIGEVISDELAREHPMHRLVQGEVGSGKTVVALRAMLQVVDAGGQAALLAPTEVLAAQHARSLNVLLGPLAAAGQIDAAEDATRIALLTGSLSAAARRAALAEAAGGGAGIVVGTHALLQEHVQFADLGLVVIDEQHRFGVEQRDALRMKATRPPHVLVMTATPIPRTVAMTVYGDLDTSALRELPKGRSPISTTVVPAAEKPEWLERVWARIHEEVHNGRQAYVVCPRIGESEDSESAEGGSDNDRRPPLAVLDVEPMLSDGPLADLTVAQLHGRMSTEDKDAVMQRFGAGNIDVLVATTVVEVGVDVPNATVMVIMDADRFGVSQLHQLRGRVGRGQHPGLCLLVTDAPQGSPARERLDSVASTVDGFELARLDLEQRREGDVLGAAQSGRRSTVKLLSLLRDEDLIAAARDEALQLIEADPGLDNHPTLAELVASIADERADYLEKA